MPRWTRELGSFPGVDWSFSQPISDNVEEAVSGVKGELAVKLFGTDLTVLEQKANEIQGVMAKIPGSPTWEPFRYEVSRT